MFTNSLYYLLPQSMMNITIISYDCQVGAIILTPTRELALQIDEVLEKFLANMSDDERFSHLVLVGGNNPGKDIEAIVETGFVHAPLRM